MPYKKGHMFLVHANKVTAKATMKILNYSLEAFLNKPCEYCAVAKLKQKNVYKTTLRLDLKKDKGWFIDLRNIKWVALGRKKFWALFIDYETNYCVSRFIQKRTTSRRKDSNCLKRSKQ